MELLNKMKNMPGMEDMQQMFSQMGIPGLGKGAKINMGAMEAQLNRNMKNSKIKERMRARVDANAKAKEQNELALLSNNNNETSEVFSKEQEEELLKIFSTGETVEKTPRGAKPPKSNKKKGNK